MLSIVQYVRQCKCRALTAHICSFLQKFMDAIWVQFSMIDVAKHQLELQKGAKNKLLTLTKEVKIITSSDDTFKLWQKVISCATQRDLIDVDSKELTKFKDHKNFEPEKDGVLTREFFKFLSNLSEADHAKLCRHILNQSGPSRNSRTRRLS